MRMRRHYLGVLLMFIACGSISPAHAIDYHVHLNAPEQWREIFMKHLDLIRFQGDERMNAEQLERFYRRMPDQIRQMLAAQGYFQPVIRSDWKMTAGTPHITLHIETGKRMNIGRFSIELEGPILNDPDYPYRLEAVQAATEFETGLPFTQTFWDSGKSQGLNALAIEKYPKAHITHSLAEVDLDQNAASLQLRYSSGLAYRFGTLSVEGLQSYPESVVRNLNTFYQGEFYSQQALLDLQSALQKTPYFSSVFVESEFNEDTGDAPVTVRVEEAERQRVSVGGGFSTNGGARGELSYQHNNVMKRGWIGKVSVREEQNQGAEEVNLTLPQTQKKYQDAFSMKHEHKDIQNVKTSTLRLAAFRSRSANNIDVTYGVSYLRERQERFGAQTQDLRVLLPSYQWHQRRFDDPIYPQDGYAWRLELSAGSRSMLSSTDVVRGYVRGVRYLPLRKELGFLTMRAEVGRVWSKQTRDVPQELLFRTGGTASVRGYAYESLGVKDRAATLGGKVMYSGSIEYQYPFTPQWGGAVFWDVGDAGETWQTLKMHHGFGVGGRWRSPVGPLALDLAYGKSEQKLRMHFALNLSF